MKEDEVNLDKLKSLSYSDLVMDDSIEKEINKRINTYFLSDDHDLLYLVGASSSYRKKKIKKGFFSKPTYVKVKVVDSLHFKRYKPTADALVVTTYTITEGFYKTHFIKWSYYGKRLMQKVAVLQKEEEENN